MAEVLHRQGKLVDSVKVANQGFLLRQLTVSIDYRDGLVKFDLDPIDSNHNF